MTNQPRRDCQFSCDRCGISTAVRCDLPVIHGCGGQPAQRTTPTRPTRRITLATLLRFAAAMARHLANRGQRRTPWEIAAIAKICRACPHYRPAANPTQPRWWQRLLRITPAEGSCSKCGCRLSAQATTWANKLAWRSEHCPDDPLKW